VGGVGGGKMVDQGREVLKVGPPWKKKKRLMEVQKGVALQPSEGLHGDPKRIRPEERVGGVGIRTGRKEMIGGGGRQNFWKEKGSLTTRWESKSSEKKEGFRWLREDGFKEKLY